LTASINLHLCHRNKEMMRDMTDGTMPLFAELNNADALEEIENGVFQSIDERQRVSSEERPLLSIHDESHFRQLSYLYLPSPTLGEQETPPTEEARHPLNRRKAFREIVRSKIMEKEAGLVDSVELRHALDPNKPKTVDMFHDMLLVETSQGDLLAVKEHTHQARPSTQSDSEREPLLDSANTQTSYDGGSGGSPTTVRQRYYRGPSFSQRLCKCLAAFFFRPYLWAGFACFAVAWVLYYHLKDPSIDLLNNASISWWLNFCGRQLITLQIAFWAQYVLIDFFVLSCKPVANLLGPLLTVWAIQSRGFNFIITTWGVVDAILLHGDNDFQNRWMHWTGWKIYQPTEYGVKILSSTLYSRILISMIVAGVISSIKRTWFGVLFDRKILRRFKPRLQGILKDILVLTDLSDLGYEAHKQAFAAQASPRSSHAGSERAEPNRLLAAAKARGGEMRKELEVSFDLNSSSQTETEDSLRPPRSEDEGGDDSNDLDKELKEMKKEAIADRLQRTSSGVLLVKDKLDRWIPPETKGDKTHEASLREVLSFRRVLFVMDLSAPFGDSFGNASTRDDCIESAHRVFEQLLLLNHEPSENLSFEVISTFAYDSDGNLDRTKLFQLRRVFRPDGNNELSLLAFVQSCDTLYRRFRYFRASVTNASVLDQTVESVFDKFFYALMTLVVLAYLGLNPMPILLSLSTVLVSLSFAMGSSAASFVEGVSLILVRAPYDLGDRIMLTNPLVDGQPLIENSYLVSDINLHTTTLTHTGTNQVSTVKNGSLKDSRIVNLNRSGHGLVRFDVAMSLGVLEDNKLAELSEEVSKYCRDHPRSWDNLLVVRINDLDYHQEQVTIRLIVRHRNSWQDAARILRDRGLMYEFIYRTARNRGFQYVNTPAARIIYMGGKLLDGSQGDGTSRTDLLTKGNMKSVESSLYPIGA